VRRAPLVLALWTLLTWTVRIRNVVQSDQGAGSLVLPVGLTALAVWTLADRRRGGLALAGATIAAWFVRVPLVLAHDHPVGFKVVHVVLAMVSSLLAGLVLRPVVRSRSRQRQDVGVGS
jgi:hypothetical protein